MMKTNAEMLELYQQAEIAVLTGKEFMLNGKKVVREDLAQIQAGMRIYERKLKAETDKAAGRGGPYSVARWN